MLPYAISDITKSHINALLADGISENRELDYKRELPEGPDRRIGFLKDVAAFANTNGGDLVFGIEEERNSESKHTGRAARILGVKDLDDARKIKLEQWIRTGIEPRVYVQLRQIDGYPDGPVLVVRVQKSWVGPHMVKDEFRFWSRGNQGNFEMNALQVREAVLRSQSVAEQVTTFCRKRTQEMQTEHATIPLVPGPAMVLHVVPIAGLSRNDIDLQLAKGAVLPLRGRGNERFKLLRPGGRILRWSARVSRLRSTEPMNDSHPARVLDALLYDVLQAAVMLLFLLSSGATNRRKHHVAPGVAHPIAFPGLSLCLFPAIIQVPDDDLYGPNGAAARMAYTGWIAETYALWENRYRNNLQASITAGDAIRPEMDAFGDLRHIRNDLLHNNGIASAEQARKCVVLKWFRQGEQMVLGTRHVLDFLNQIGALSLGSAHNTASHSCVLSVHPDRDALLEWRPEPRLVSVRTHGTDTRTDLYKAVTVVFDNGLFANVPFKVRDTRQREVLGNARISPDGSALVFADGATAPSREIYEIAVAAHCDRRGDGELRLPVTGPRIRIRR